MSYNPCENEDSISEFISRCTDLTLIFRQLVECKNFDDSINWFTKAYNINQRKTFEFIDNNISKFSKEQLSYFNQYRKNTNFNVNYYID